MNVKIKALTNDYVEDIVILKVEQQKEMSKTATIKELQILEDAEREFLEKHLNKDLTIYGMFKDNEIIAISGMQIYESSPGTRNINGLMAYICNVYTLPQHRKSGYQHVLLNHCIKIASEKQIRIMFLATSNSIASDFYKRHGFKVNEMMLVKYNNV